MSERIRTTASRLLNGHQGISADVALALERIGWSTAEFWMRRQASYDLSAARNRHWPWRSSSLLESRSSQTRASTLSRSLSGLT